MKEGKKEQEQEQRRSRGGAMSGRSSGCSTMNYLEHLLMFSTTPERKESDTGSRLIEFMVRS